MSRILHPQRPVIHMRHGSDPNMVMCQVCRRGDSVVEDPKLVDCPRCQQLLAMPVSEREPRAFEMMLDDARQNPLPFTEIGEVIKDAVNEVGEMDDEDISEEWGIVITPDGYRR